MSAPGYRFVFVEETELANERTQRFQNNLDRRWLVLAMRKATIHRKKSAAGGT